MPFSEPFYQQTSLKCQRQAGLRSSADVLLSASQCGKFTSRIRSSANSLNVWAFPFGEVSRPKRQNMRTEALTSILLFSTRGQRAHPFISLFQTHYCLKRLPSFSSGKKINPSLSCMLHLPHVVVMTSLILTITCTFLQGQGHLRPADMYPSLFSEEANSQLPE